MKKILFIYDHSKPERLIYDGLWCALESFNVRGSDFPVYKCNLAFNEELPLKDFDFVLGWGGFDSKVDKFIQQFPKKGLCLSAPLLVNETAKNYDVIFYETEEVKKWLMVSGLTKLVHAFGINTEIFEPIKWVKVGEEDSIELLKVWDVISVGSFIEAHRQDKLYDILGNNIAVGEITPENIQKSFNYIANLLLKGWTVANWIQQEKLAQLYNMSKKFVATASFGQERAVLEARACGIPIEVPSDNPKLKELLTSPIWDIPYYASQLKKGIEECLK